MSFVSKLPRVGTTIFSVMSALANEMGATNLSQGFPDFEVAPELLDLVVKAMRAGHNQYAPMPGVPALREAIATKSALMYGYTPDWQTEITVTSGASEALFDALACLVRAGDEVVILEPAYDLYVPTIEVLGARAVPIALSPANGYAVDWAAVAAAITPHTRAVMINTPHNPSGAILQEADMQALVRVLAAHPQVYLISDEVYEHIIFDGEAHQSVLRYPALRARAFVVSSFGKTYHMTGWKIGYCIAPALLTAEFRKVHQFNTFSSSTPMQHAIAQFLQREQEYLELPVFYQARRDAFREMLRATDFEILPCAGTYFQLVSYKHLSQERDTDYCQRLTREVGVATIPVSVFYDQPTDHKVIRFCFAKRTETLEQGIEKLIKHRDKLRS